MNRKEFEEKCKNVAHNTTFDITRMNQQQFCEALESMMVTSWVWIEQYGEEQRIDEKIVGKNCGNCKSLENKQSYTHCQRCKQNCC